MAFVLCTRDLIFGSYMLTCKRNALCVLLNGNTRHFRPALNWKGEAPSSVVIDEYCAVLEPELPIIQFYEHQMQRMLRGFDVNG
jgi:hypothetical protein